jgi:hypothetical protein
MREETIKSLGFSMRPYTGTGRRFKEMDRVFTSWVVDEGDTFRWASPDEIMLWHILAHIKGESV